MSLFKAVRRLIISFSEISSFLSLCGTVVGCVCLLLMMSLITVDVVGRNLFNSPMLGIDHVTAYLLVALVFMGLGYTFKKDAHIKVDVITRKLPQKINQRLELGVHVAGMAGSAVILWHSLRMVYASYTMGTKLISGAFQIPAYLIQLFVPLGFALLFLQIIVGFLNKVVKTEREPSA